jgi:TonB family protein
MRRAWKATGMLATACLIASVWIRGQTPEPKYIAAKLSQAGSIAYPMNVRQPGFVSVNVNVGSDGSVQQFNVVRDVPPLTNAVQSALVSWQFTPAMLKGQAVSGIVPVDVAFNPYNPSGVGLPGESLQSSAAAASGDYQPAVCQNANYANYPPNTVASGTVVLLVHLNASGQVGKVQVLRGNGVLSGPSVDAVKTWSFTPATYRAKAVSSNVVVAFVYPAPQAGAR